MNNNKHTKLTLESYGNIISWESPYIDAPLDDILYGFYGLCIAATWNPKSVIKAMYNFASEQIETNEEKPIITYNTNFAEKTLKNLEEKL